MEKLFKAIQLICHTLRTDRQTHLMYKEDTSHTRRTHLMYKEDTSRTRRTHLIQGGHISYKGDTFHTRGHISYKGDTSHTRRTHLMYKEDASHTRGTHLIQGGHISYKGDTFHTRRTHLIQGGHISYKGDTSHTRGTHLIQGGHISYKGDASHVQGGHISYKEDTSHTRRTHLIQGGHISYKEDTSHVQGGRQWNWNYIMSWYWLPSHYSKHFMWQCVVTCPTIPHCHRQHKVTKALSNYTPLLDPQLAQGQPSCLHLMFVSLPCEGCPGGPSSEQPVSHQGQPTRPGAAKSNTQRHAHIRTHACMHTPHHTTPHHTTPNHTTPHHTTHTTDQTHGYTQPGRGKGKGRVVPGPPQRLNTLHLL